MFREPNPSIYGLRNQSLHRLSSNPIFLMPITFIRTAAWQLGKPDARVSDPTKRSRLQSERSECLKRIGKAGLESGWSFAHSMRNCRRIFSPFLWGRFSHCPPNDGWSELNPNGISHFPHALPHRSFFP